jgi:hypothetical protein
MLQPKAGLNANANLEAPATAEERSRPPAARRQASRRGPVMASRDSGSLSSARLRTEVNR